MKRAHLATLALATLGSLAVGPAAAPAAAQDAGMPDCTPPTDRGPREVLPASGARSVPIDAYVEVRFTPGYFDIGGIDPLRAFELYDGTVQVEGDIQVVGDSLFFVPTEPLRPSAMYTGTATGIDTVLDFDFRTGAGRDTEPPVGVNVEPPSTASVPVSCSAPEGGYRVDVRFMPSSDDGSPGSIEYLLYLTRANGLGAPELRARVRNFFSDPSAGTVTMAFVLTPDEAVSPACFEVHTVDGVGNVTRSEPTCFEPVQGNFFAPICSAGPRGADTNAAPFALPLLFALFARRRR